MRFEELLLIGERRGVSPPCAPGEESSRLPRARTAGLRRAARLDDPISFLKLITGARGENRWAEPTLPLLRIPFSILQQNPQTPQRPQIAHGCRSFTQLPKQRGLLIAQLLDMSLQDDFPILFR